jgi:hypothetical protein
LTPGERTFVEGLRDGYDPVIKIVGPPELDQILIEFLPVHEFITREPVLEALRRATQERAALLLSMTSRTESRTSRSRRTRLVPTGALMYR